MNRYIEKIVQGLDSFAGEIFVSTAEFAVTLAGAVLGLFQILTAATPFWWLATVLCGYFGWKALENLLYVGLNDEPEFGEEIYFEED